jgi:hypothetical protein
MNIDKMNIDTIPIVYMWVDGDDPEYKKRHNIHTSSRNRDNNDLMYSLRSLEENLSWWKGQLYIVTDKQVPKWLNQGHPRLRVVDHTEIIPAKYLPTRDSSTIEWFLHLIPGIEDFFIAMNDDVLFLKPCNKMTFFTADDKPKVVFNKNMLTNTKESPNVFKTQSKMWLSNVHNTMNILEEKMGHSFKNKRYIQHSPKIFSKKAIQELHKILAEEFDKSSIIKERHYGSLNTLYCIQYYMTYYFKLEIQPSDVDEFFKDIVNNTKVFDILYEIKNSKCYYICVNDNFSDNNKKDELNKMYGVVFPKPSEFEVLSAHERKRFQFFLNQNLKMGER